MGLVKYPSISDHWALSSIFCNKKLSSRMSRDRFKQILSNLIFYEKNEKRADGYELLYNKLLELIITVLENSKKYYKHSQVLSLDESNDRIQWQASGKSLYAIQTNSIWIQSIKAFRSINRLLAWVVYAWSIEKDYGTWDTERILRLSSLYGQLLLNNRVFSKATWEKYLGLRNNKQAQNSR